MRLKIAACSLALISALPAYAHEFSNLGITVAHPWARATPGGATVGAAFLEIKADDKTTDKLVGVTAEIAGRGEIHTHKQEGDVMKMRKVDALDIAPGKSVVLKPMGDHIMLMDLKAPLKEGDLLKFTLQFEKAGKIEVEATVEPIGAMGPHGMDHQPGNEDHDAHGSKPQSGDSGKSNTGEDHSRH